MGRISILTSLIYLIKIGTTVVVKCSREILYKANHIFLLISNLTTTTKNKFVLAVLFNEEWGD